MEDSKSIAKPLPASAADSKKRKELVDRYRSQFANGSSSDRKLAAADFHLLAALTEFLKLAKSGDTLDLSLEDRTAIEFVNPQAVAEFASTFRQIGGELTSLRFPPAMLSVPRTWVRHLPGLREVSFSAMFMGRAMVLHALPKLRKVAIGNPVNLKLLSIPSGCEVGADADFPIAFDKNFETRDPAGVLIERGFLAVVEYDKPGVPRCARRYRMTEPHWQRSSDSLERRHENLIGEVHDPKAPRTLLCAELATLWLSDRYAYRQSKQQALVRHPPGKTAAPKRFDYESFASIASLLEASQRNALLDEFYELCIGSPSQHCVRVPSWPQFVRSRFQALSGQPAGAFSLFALSTVNHVLAVEFLIHAGPDGKPMYILTSYDPNITRLHRRQVAHNLSEIESWRLEQLSAELSDNKDYQPPGVHDPSVFLAEYRMPMHRTDASAFPNAELTRKVLSFWPALNHDPIDSACQLLLLRFLHLDLWEKLVVQAIAPLSEHDRARYLAVPFVDDGKLKSALAANFCLECSRQQFIRMLDSMSYSPQRLVEMVISVQACGSFDAESVQSPDAFEYVVAAMLDFNSMLKEKTPSAQEIAKLLSLAEPPQPGLKAMIHAMALADIGAWLGQLKRLLDAQLIGLGEVKHIIASHHPARKDGWFALLRDEVDKGRYWCVRGFYFSLDALKLCVSDAGLVTDPPVGDKNLRAGPASWRLLKTHHSDPVSAMQALALSICGHKYPQPAEALFNCLRFFGKSDVVEMFDAIWELSMRVNDRWKFIATALGTIQATSSQGKRYLFNELVQVQKGDTVSFHEESADASQTIDGIVLELLKLRATGMPESLWTDSVKSLIDPATPNDTALNDVLLKRLNLCWANRTLTALPRAGKARA